MGNVTTDCAKCNDETKLFRRCTKPCLGKSSLELQRSANYGARPAGHPKACPRLNLEADPDFLAYLQDHNWLKAYNAWPHHPQDVSQQDVKWLDVMDLIDQEIAAMDAEDIADARSGKSKSGAKQGQKRKPMTGRKPR